jgi:hypothetical protein
VPASKGTLRRLRHFVSQSKGRMDQELIKINKATSIRWYGAGHYKTTSGRLSEIHRLKKIASLKSLHAKSGLDRPQIKPTRQARKTFRATAQNRAPQPRRFCKRGPAMSSPGRMGVAACTTRRRSWNQADNPIVRVNYRTQEHRVDTMGRAGARLASGRARAQRKSVGTDRKGRTANAAPNAPPEGHSRV